MVLAVFGRNAISPRRGLLIYRTVNSPRPHSALNATTPGSYGGMVFIPSLNWGRAMRLPSNERLRNQVNSLRRQFLEEDGLPFSEVLTADARSPS